MLISIQNLKKNFLLTYLKPSKVVWIQEGLKEDRKVHEVAEIDHEKLFSARCVLKYPMATRGLE